MKYINITLATISVFIILSCSHNSDTYRQLIAVDSLLLEHNYEDSALFILNNIVPKTKRDSAYYNILKISAAFRREKTINNFAGINSSIKYYTDNYDARKLAYAYYYKSTIYIELDSAIIETVPLLKKAEQIANNTTDYRLLDRVYAGLTFANARLGELDEAIKSARKELFYAKKTNDSYCIAYALIYLSTLHRYWSPDTDSSKYFISQCVQYANLIEDLDKPMFYNYIGESIMNNDPAIAKQYFNDALKYKYLTDAYLNLAKIYYAENELETAKKYCDSALITPSLYSKIGTLTILAEYYFKKNNIEQYKKTTAELIETQAKISQKKESRKILELQRKFDFEKQQTDFDKKVLILILTIVLLVFICLFTILLHKQRMHATREKELELENRNSQLYSEILTMSTGIDLYEKQILQLKNENKYLSNQKSNLAQTIANNNAQIERLQNKIEKLNKQKYEYIETGKIIYHKIEQNQPITMFDDKWANCVYYFIYIENENIFDRYNGLTVNDKIFLIADAFLKKSDEEIAKILAVSTGTVRSRRSKIKRKKEHENELI